MKKVMLLVVSFFAFASLAIASPVPGVVMDTQGFEGFTAGTIDGQTAGYWNPGCGGSKSWTIQTGPAETAQIVDIGGERGKVLSIEPGWATNAGGGFKLDAHMEWNTPAVDGDYWGIEHNRIVIEFDILVEGGADNPWIMSAVETDRNHYTVPQTRTAIGAWNDVDQVDFESELRQTPEELVGGYPTWKHLTTTTESAWHSVKITQNCPWAEALQDIEIFVDGALVGEGKGIWNGWPGYLGRLYLWGYNVENYDAGDTQLYYDNVKVSYDAVPEPATLSVLAFGALALLRRRKA